MIGFSRSTVGLLTAGFVAVLTGLVLTLGAAAQDKPKPVQITEEWMQENTQAAYKELLKGNRVTTKAQFAPNAATYAKAAEKLAGFARIIGVSDPPKLKKPKKVWDGYADEMNKAAEDMAKAAGAGNLDDFKKAFARADTACNKCHTDFK